MSFTTAYNFASIKTEFITGFSANGGGGTNEFDPSIIATADGGFALSFTVNGSGGPGDHNMFLERFDAAGVQKLAGLTLGGATQLSTLSPGITLAHTATTQLSGGNLLSVWSKAGDGLRYAVVNSATGAIVTADTHLATTTALDFLPDVTALAANAFAVVTQHNTAVNDQDADLIIYNAAGVQQASVALGDNSSADEQAPVVATLNNGNIVVAYEKELADNTNTFGMAVEIFTAAGADVLIPFNFDILGNDNRRPDILALNDGGFAVGYEDNEYGEQGVTVAFFTQAGVLRGKVRADADFFSDDDVHLSRMANGFVSAEWTDNGVDIKVAVLDPVSLTRLGSPFVIENQNGQQERGGIAALSNGTFVSAWSDFNNAIADGNTDADGEHVSLQIDTFRRISTSDGAGDSITGDSLIDLMAGNGGNDTLNGAGGNDSIDGGTGTDSMTGGAGNDSFVVDNAGDLVFEALNQGNDLVKTGLASYTLTANVEQLVYTGAGNFIGKGSNVANKLFAGAGNDHFIMDASGNDLYQGYGGVDTGDFRSLAAATVNLATNVHGGTALGDTFLSLERFYGSSTGGDSMTAGNAAAMIFSGFGGGDTLTGGSQADTLSGGAGNDSLIGGLGSDALNGGLDNDTMTGGGGADTFVYDAVNFGQDTVTDYQDGSDRLKVSAAVANALGDFTLAGNGTAHVTLTLIGGSADTIDLFAAGAISITAGDFIFY